jgi:Peroxiredoxin
MTLQKGDSAEDFELLDHNGNSVTLSSFKGSKNVVLCFYPKNHLFACPSKKVFEMAKSVISVYPQITATETVLFAISVDSVDSQSEKSKSMKFLTCI